MLEYPESGEPLSGFPYSNVVMSGDLVVIASQVPFNDANHLVGTGFSEQAHQVFTNLAASLKAAGCGFPDVIRVGGYLAHVDHFAEYNEIYRTYFSPPYPARTTVACSLVVPGMLIQVDALARRPTA
jgi:2-iminobutanoate/2-iminopropanoate deaminase